MNWIKEPTNPIVCPKPGSWKHDRCTSVTVCFKDETCYFYHDGGIGYWWNDTPGFNWIGLMTCPAAGFDGKTFTPFIGNPVLSHGRFCDFDRTGMISPRVELIDGRFFLYYCGVSYVDYTPGECPTWRKATGLAVSDDGINFEKVGREPVVETPPDYVSGNPKPFLHDGCWHMLTVQAPQDRSAGIAICLQTSDDPYRFAGAPERVFEPGPTGAWDASSIAAPAFCRDSDSDWYYMLYGGCEEHWDYPKGIGLARSRDLRHWERYPANPIFMRGGEGEWDDGALWVTELIKVNGTWYAWYEGRSAGRDRETEYSPGATKQIGLITCTGDLWS